MNSPSSKAYYWDIANATRMGDYLTRVEKRFLSSYLKRNGQIQSILDVGGGSGRIAIPLSKLGYEIFVTEVDPLPLLILKSKRRELDAIVLEKKSKVLPFRSGSFDLILCLQVIALSEEADWFFPECHRILNENGSLIFTILNRKSYKGILRSWQLTKDLLRGEYWKKKEYRKTLPEIHCNLKRAGFSSVLARGYNWIPLKRSSDHWFVPFLAFIEERMGLQYLPFISPWVLMAAKKSNGDRKNSPCSG